MPKVVDHAAYRAELLDGCAELFAARGYSGLSTREIAEALGVSTGTLYHYFDGKRDLFLRLVEHLTEDLVATVRDGLTPGESPEERLDALLADVAEREEWYARYNRLCLDHLRERPVGGEAVMAATLQRATEALADALSLTPAGARFVFVTLFGLVIERDLDGGATPFWEQADELRRWFSATRTVLDP